MHKKLTVAALFTILVASSSFLAPALAESGSEAQPPASAPPPPAPAPENTWRFAVTPYLWLAGIDGTLRYEIPPGSGNTEETDVGLGLEDLNFTFMVNAEARTGRWSILMDLLYVDLTSNSDSVDSVTFGGSGGRVDVDVHSSSDTTTDITGVEAALAGGYTLTRGDGPVFVEVIGGVRYLTVRAESEWQLEAKVTGPNSGQSFKRSGSVSERAELYDGIVGAQGEFALGSRWFIPWHADVGAGSSTLTYQGVAGIGYRFKGWDVRLTYRYLHYDMDENNLLQNVSFSGAAVGAKIRF